MVSDTWKYWYNALKRTNPEAYRKAIQYAENVSLSRGLHTALAAEIEVSHVMLACELLGVEATNDGK